MVSSVDSHDHSGRTQRGQNSPIQIWYFITALSVGGAERTLVDLANNLDEQAYEVTVWTIFDQNPLKEELVGVTHRSLGAQGEVPQEGPSRVERASNPLDYIRAPLRFLKAVRTEQPDIIQSFLFYDNLIARIAGLVCPKTSIITGERGFHNEAHAFIRLTDRLTVALSDKIVTNSKAGARSLSDYGVPNEKISVIYNGRNLDRYRNGFRRDVDEMAAFSEDGPIIGTVGRLVERKGHGDLLTAWPQIKADHPSAELVLIGDGPDRELLETRVNSQGTDHSVHFLGTRDDIPALLDLIDVFVFPSHWEGLPGALLEAMAAALPIVATRVNGNSELITDQKTGLLIPPHDPAAIQSAVTTLLNDSTVATSLGESAQELAYERFTLEAMVDRFETFYETLSKTSPVTASEKPGLGTESTHE